MLYDCRQTGCVTRVGFAREVSDIANTRRRGRSWKPVQLHNKVTSAVGPVAYSTWGIPIRPLSEKLEYVAISVC